MIRLARRDDDVGLGAGPALAEPAEHVVGPRSRRRARVGLAGGAVLLLSGALLTGPAAVGAAPASPAPPDPGGGSTLARPGVLTDLPAGVPAPPALPAGAYLLADLDDGRVLVAKNARVPAKPASTIKVLTALTLVPRLDPRTVVRATPEDAAVDGTKVGLDPGESYTVGQLFQSLLMSSANDSAVALARANGGAGVTTAQMNETLRALGTHDTVIKNASGLDAPGQVTSAFDLALIGRAAVAVPDIQAYVTTKRADFPGRRVTPGGRRGVFEISNHNKLLWNYAGTLGVKNGYTVAARFTFVGVVRRGDQTYALTYLGGENGSWRPSAALLDWAFAHGSKARAVDTLDAAPRAGGDQAAAGGVPASAAALTGGPAGGGTTTLSDPRVRAGVVVVAVALAVVAGIRRRRRR